MLIAPKRLQLRTSNLTHVFPGTVRTWPQKFSRKGDVFNNLLGGDVHSHERLLVDLAFPPSQDCSCGLCLALPYHVRSCCNFWTRKGRQVPKTYSSCSCSSCCWSQFSKGPKIPGAFLTRSGAQRNFAYTFLLTLPTNVPSHIFPLFSN